MITLFCSITKKNYHRDRPEFSFEDKEFEVSSDDIVMKIPVETSSHQQSQFVFPLSFSGLNTIN